eukprot:2719842-Rhodomonas_salina.2
MRLGWSEDALVLEKIVDVDLVDRLGRSPCSRLTRALGCHDRDMLDTMMKKQEQRQSRGMQRRAQLFQSPNSDAPGPRTSA